MYRTFSAEVMGAILMSQNQPRSQALFPLFPHERQRKEGPGTRLFQDNETVAMLV